MPETSSIIAVRVTPRARADAIEGWRDGTLLVRVTAAPVEGRANVAVERLIAATLGVAPSHVAVVGGGSSRMKRVRIAGLDADAVRRKLGA